MADKRFVQKYYDAGMDSTEAKYAALIEGMDKSLGDIMDYLKQKKIEKNTILIFMSDNGGLSLAPPRGGIPQTQNFPLKAGKGSVYEGGIREPIIVKWPVVVKPNSSTHQYIIIEDFYSTILEMAGIKNYTTVQTVDGKSFVPVLKNPNGADSTRALIWHMPNKWTTKDGPGINYFSAVRKGKWKMVYNMRTGSRELYNLDDDIEENKNLTDKYPDKLKELSKIISDKLRAWKSPMPSFENKGKAVPLPDEL